MRIARSLERSRKATTPVAKAVTVDPFAGTGRRMRISTRALFACAVRVAEAASSTAGLGAVESGGAEVWFACACPHAVAPARRARTMRKRDGRTTSRSSGQSAIGLERARIVGMAVTSQAIVECHGDGRERGRAHGE